MITLIVLISLLVLLIICPNDERIPFVSMCPQCGQWYRPRIFNNEKYCDMCGFKCK